MTGAAALLLGVTLLVGVVDWWAVNDPGRRRVEYAAKPLTLVALIGAAVLLEPADPTVRAWFVAALVLSLAGDVFLMLEAKWFVAGLASFLVGHLAFIAGFWAGGDMSADRLAVGLVVVLVALATIGRSVIRGVRAVSAEMAVPVLAYILVISAMVVSAFGSGNPWAVGGSLLFYGSDALIAVNRFIQPRPWGRVAIMVTYHLAQIGLVLSLI